MKVRLVALLGIIWVYVIVSTSAKSLSEWQDAILSSFLEHFTDFSVCNSVLM
jgi:hypothetical protein